MTLTLKTKNVLDLIPILRQSIYKNPLEALALIRSLKDTERFQCDDEYNLLLRIEEISALCFLGYIEEVNKLIDDVYADAENSDNHDLYLEACLRLSLGYFAIDNTEKAIILNNIICQSEAEANLVGERSATAYNNLASFYYKYKKVEQAIYYWQKSYSILLELLNSPEVNENSYDTYSIVLVNLITIATDQDDLDSCSHYLEQIKQVPTEKISKRVEHFITEAKIYKSILEGNYKDIIDNIQELLFIYFSQNAFPSASQFLYNTYRYSKRAQENLKPLVNIMTPALKIIGNNTNYDLLKELYLQIIDYAIANQDHNLMVNYYRNLHNVIDNSNSDNNQRKVKELDLFVEYAQEKNLTSDLQKQTGELKELIQELQANNEKSKILNDQLRIINKLSKQILISESLTSLESIVQQDLSNIMTIDSIALFYKNQQGKFVAPYYYDQGDYLDDYSIEEDSQSKLIEEVITSGKAIITGDIYAEKINEISSSRLTKINSSLIYYPLCLDKEMVGILTIQAKEKNAYNNRHLQLIQTLSPYLVIGILNNLSTNKLNKEIKTLKEEQKRLDKLIEYHQNLSQIDALTQINNRYCFNLKYPQLLNEANSNKLSVSLFMFDIDDFKLYNDINGHIKGDESLTAIVEAIKKLQHSPSHIFARYGGEEFIIIELGLSASGAINKAKTMLKTVHNLAIKYRRDDDKNLTISLGAYHLPLLQNQSGEELLKDVDELLYQAKKKGKNTICSKLNERSAK